MTSVLGVEDLVTELLWHTAKSLHSEIKNTAVPTPNSKIVSVSSLREDAASRFLDFACIPNLHYGGLLDWFRSWNWPIPLARFLDSSTSFANKFDPLMPGEVMFHYALRRTDKLLRDVQTYEIALARDFARDAQPLREEISEWLGPKPACIYVCNGFGKSDQYVGPQECTQELVNIIKMDPQRISDLERGCEVVLPLAGGLAIFDALGSPAETQYF
jgi:hypothetical protein